MPQIQRACLLQPSYQVLRWPLSERPWGHLCCSSNHGFGNRPPSLAIPPSPREDHPLMLALPWRPRKINVIPHLHETSTLTQGQLCCLSWHCPSLPPSRTWGGALLGSACSVPSIPGVHRPLWCTVRRSSLKGVRVLFVFTLHFHT